MHVILNPAARHGGGRRQRLQIERALQRRGVQFELTETEGPGHATELAAAFAAGRLAPIVAAGGDGTMHEVINGVMRAGAGGNSVGLIPIGTGNDFARMVPGTGSIDAAVHTLAAGRTVPMDAGLAEWDGGDREYFMNAMGTGVDVEVVRCMRRSRFLPGSVLYVNALVRALMRYRAAEVRITVDTRTVTGRVMNVAVCNGPSIGGAFRICPDARPDDGQLDVCIIAEMPVLRNAMLVPRVIRGTHASRRGVTMMRGRHVQLGVTGTRPLFFQLDGELRRAHDGAAGIRVSIAPVTLDVICGRT